MAKLQRFIETTNGFRGFIGEYATYEWQTVAEVDTHEEAKQKAALLDKEHGYRILYDEGEAILVSTGRYKL
jgi:hypothetical protein